MVYLWKEKMKRDQKDPLTELLHLIGNSEDQSLEKQYEAVETEAAVGTDQGASGTDQRAAGTDQGAASTEQGVAGTDQGVASTDQGAVSTEQGVAGTSSAAPSIPTQRAPREVEMLPCIFCAKPFKVNITQISQHT